jgi:preprotein translocase subunit SecD
MSPVKGWRSRNRGVMVSLHDEETIHGVERTVVLEQRDVDADESSRVQVEETDIAAQLGVARVERPSSSGHIIQRRGWKLGSTTPRPRGEAVTDRHWVQTARNRT